MISPRQKAPPLYAITSIDHALRLASILQLEGSLTVAAAAARLNVARSTAHRVLQMLVYRDFAYQDELRVYRPGPLMQSALHSPSQVAALREASLPVLRRLSMTIGDAAEVSARLGDTVRLVARAEPPQGVRSVSTEGMAFALHHTPAGLLYLASQPKNALSLYLDRHADARERAALRAGVERVRLTGFALSTSRSDTGRTAIGVAITVLKDGPFAALSVSLPQAYDDTRNAHRVVPLLRAASAEVSRLWAGERQMEMAGRNCDLRRLAT